MPELDFVLITVLLIIRGETGTGFYLDVAPGMRKAFLGLSAKERSGAVWLRRLLFLQRCFPRILPSNPAWRRHAEVTGGSGQRT